MRHGANDVADIAEAVEVSVRALQQGFRRLGTTPSARLRAALAKSACRDLLGAGPDRSASVTEVAFRGPSCT